MKIILEQDQHELGLFSPDDRPVDFERQAVRAVVLNDANEVALIVFTRLNSRKLPGGGIDEGETIEEALFREVQEETGFELKEVIAEIGIVDETRYCSGMHQVSHAYLVRVGGYTHPEPTQHETEQGISVEWVRTIDDAVTYIQGAATMDEDGSDIGGIMMHARDIAILKEAQVLLKS